MEKITEIATNLINGNISSFKESVKKLTHLEFINLIFEYTLISNQTHQEVLNEFHRIL